jgi:hypothetical protein
MTEEQAGLGAADVPAQEKARAPRNELEAFTKDDLALLYLRQTRTAAVTIAVLAVVGVIAAVIIGIVVAIEISHENNLLNHGIGTATSAGISQRGSHPNSHIG